MYCAGVRVLTTFALLGAVAPAAQAERRFTVHHGATRLTLDAGLLAGAGLSVRSASVDASGDSDTEILLQPYPSDEPIAIGSNGVVIEGGVSHYWGLILTSKGGSFYADQVVTPADLQLDPDAPIQLIPSWVRFDPTDSSLTVDSDVIIGTNAVAAALGDESLLGARLGRATTVVYLAPVNDAADGVEHAGDAACGGSTGGVADRGGCTPSIGPDVIVGEMPAIANYSAVGGIDAFAVATTSCNIGDIDVNWTAGTGDHPVVPQNMYRMKPVDGATRFEQIGQSWIKHTFTVLPGTVCCTTCNGMGGGWLGVGCSDPYDAPRNGTQVSWIGGLGPRFQVNPHTGGFPFPYMFRNDGSYIPHNAITRRLQVAISDLDPGQNIGASYFVETQYLTPHDARYGNQDNNCSYRPCTVTGAAGASNFNATTGGTTQRMKPAIQAWKIAEPEVTETWIATPEQTGAAPANDATGTLIVSSKATQLSATTWRFEYAVFNMNSDRAISSFSVPVADAVSVSNIGFHDVRYHSGDGYNSQPGAVVTFDGADWPGAKTSGAVVWSLTPATPVENSNAIRWGTMYNFRFDAEAGPIAGAATLGLFKAVAGRPDSVTGAAQTPAVPPPPCPTDVNGDRRTDLTDLSLLLTHFGLPGGAQHGDGDIDGDGDVDLSDLALLLGQFGSDCPTE